MKVSFVLPNFSNKYDPQAPFLQFLAQQSDLFSLKTYWEIECDLLSSAMGYNIEKEKFQLEIKSIRFEKIRHHKQDQIMKGDDPLQMFERKINENDEVFLVTIEQIRRGLTF